MAASLSRSKSIFLLSLVAMLERYSYFGVRVLMLLFVIAPDGLGIAPEEANPYFGYFKLLLVFLILLGGIITDKFLGQIKSIQIGGIISLLGYSLLIIQTTYAVLIGLFFIAVGTGLVQPNNELLIGRLYDKAERQRSLAYIVFFTLINLGALLSTFRLGILADEGRWTLGFVSCLIANVAYLLLLYFNKDKLIIKEKNTIEGKADKSVQFNEKRIALIGMFILLGVFFWEVAGYADAYILQIAAAFPKVVINGFVIRSFLLEFLIPVLPFLFLLIIGVYWYFKSIKNAIIYLMAGLFLLGGGVLVLYFAQPFIALESVLGPLLVLGVGKAIFNAVYMSYLTRITDVHYSSTVYGVYIFVPYLIALLFGYKDDLLTAGILLTLGTVALIMAFILLLFKKDLCDFSGID